MPQPPTLKEDRQIGTAFQCGELVGPGLRFGPGEAYEIGLRLAHHSNGGITAHNAGITFGVVRAAYNFRSREAVRIARGRSGAPLLAEMAIRRC